MIILIHSSKTIKPVKVSFKLTTPVLLKEAQLLHAQLSTLSIKKLAKLMKISEKLALKVAEQIAQWDSKKTLSPAIRAFAGDIYSGLQADSLSGDDLEYAQNHLRILSGLYGVLKPLDAINPYRYEMGYAAPTGHKSMYTYWDNRIAKTLEKSDRIINVSSVEYTKAVLSHIATTRVITPKFMTLDPKTKQPKFIVVHAKVARGAFARWLIDIRADNTTDLTKFDRLDYRYSAKLSTASQPVFVCSVFKGIGLSVRLL